MTIFVTGATGFVGENLIKRLDNLGFDAWAVVRKKTFRIKEIELDLGSCSEDEIFEKLRSADCIVHLAANADFTTNFRKEVYDINCHANFMLTNVFKKINAHFIFASNALISGMHEPYIHSNSSDKPEIPYNIAKYISEEYIMKYIKDYCILRIGGIYGFKGPEHLFLNRAINYAINHKQLLSIQNDGLGRRNYIYVEDLCSWIIYIIKHRTIGKYLVAGKDSLSLKDIFIHINNTFLGGNENVSINEVTMGTDQLIESIPPNIIMHDYQMAFSDIKQKLGAI